jgi:hypothetical protein
MERIACTVNAGKRIYQNMLIRALPTRSDRENSLEIWVFMQEIIIATTHSYLLSPAAMQAVPQKTAPVLNPGTLSLQSAPNFNSRGGL